MALDNMPVVWYIANPKEEEVCRYRSTMLKPMTSRRMQKRRWNPASVAVVMDSSGQLGRVDRP
jgi:hypothetical protein